MFSHLPIPIVAHFLFSLEKFLFIKEQNDVIVNISKDNHNMRRQLDDLAQDKESATEKRSVEIKLVERMRDQLNQSRRSQDIFLRNLSSNRKKYIHMSERDNSS